MIVVENGSTDDGPDKVRNIVDHRIKLIEAPTCVSGPGAARNLGVAQSCCEWVLFLDADDLIEKNHLKSLLDVVSQKPEVTVVAGGWKQFDENDLEQITTELRPAGESHCVLDTAIASAPWAVHAAIVKRSLLDSVSWPESMDGMLAEDNHFWFSICLKACVAISPGSGALYRQNTHGCRSQNENIEAWFNGVHHAATLNLKLLENSVQTPTKGQFASLMQLYLNLYRSAKKTGNATYADKALRETERWFKLTELKSQSKLPYFVRRVLGIKKSENLLDMFGSFYANLPKTIKSLK